jgi:transposase-like protein
VKQAGPAGPASRNYRRENEAIMTMLSAQCPHCKSLDFRSVGLRNGVERALNWLLAPYRCGLCGRHFFLFRWLAPAEGAA